MVLKDKEEREIKKVVKKSINAKYNALHVKFSTAYGTVKFALHPREVLNECFSWFADFLKMLKNQI